MVVRAMAGAHGRKCRRACATVIGSRKRPSESETKVTELKQIEQK